MPPIRLCFYDDAPTFGGHELMVLRLLQHLAPQGQYEITLIASQRNVELARRIRDAVPQVKWVLTPYTSGRGQWLRSYLSLGPLLQLRRLLKTQAPALLVVVQGGIALSSLAVLAGRLAGVRTLSYLPMAHDESMFAPSPWQAKVRHWFVQPFYGLPDGLVTIGQRMAADVRRRRRGDVQVVENGVPPLVATPGSGEALREALGVASGERLLLMIGRIEFWQKRHDLAVQALALAQARCAHEGQRLHLLVVGSGPDEAALRQQVQASGLAEAVHWRPWQDDVGVFYAACDVLLLPSRYEGVPLVMLEAMQAGRRILASRVDGMADLLPTAWTFASGNAQALADLMHLPDSAADAQHIQRHREQVDTRFSLQAFGSRFQQVIDDQIAAARGARGTAPAASAKVNVAVVEPVGGHGGMNFYDFSLCRGIVDAGAAATLFTCDSTVVSGNEGFPVKRPYRGIYGQGRAWVRGLRFLWGSLCALPAARCSGHRVVHFHFFFVGALELFNVLLARALGMQVVITAHDVQAFKEGLSVPLFVKWAYRLARRVIAHSQVAKRELVQDLGLAPEKIDVILHGNYIASVPAQPSRELARAHFGIAADRRVLVFFGQIKDVKGLEVLLEGFALARQQDPRLHLLIGGRVWKTDFSKYAQIIDRHGLAPHCSLHIRYIPDAEVAYFYRCADLAVLPYLRIYQSGAVLLALSHGSPVLVSDIAGMLEVISDGRTGFVFRSQDPAHLAQRVLEIFSAPQRCAEVAQAGLSMVTVRNDWGRLGEQSLRCYQQALSGQA
jgi:D-inositol-3-phosphate glycosyltransferase